MTLATVADDVSTVLAGNRRCYQYLRLIDTDESKKARAPLEPLDARDLHCVGVALCSQGLPNVSRLPAGPPAAWRIRALELRNRTEQVTTMAQLPDWVTAMGAEALGMFRQALPRQADRLEYYRIASRHAYDSEEAGASNCASWPVSASVGLFEA